MDANLESPVLSDDEQSEQITQQDAAVALLRRQYEQSLTDCEESLNPSGNTIQRIRAAERIQLSWRRLNSADRRSRESRRAQDADRAIRAVVASATSSERGSSPSRMVVSPPPAGAITSPRAVSALYGLRDGSGNSSAVVQAASAIQQMWRRRAAEQCLLRARHAIAAQRIQRLWRQYREALEDYDETASVGSAEQVAEAAEVIQQRWRRYRAAMAMEQERAAEPTRNTTSPPPPTDGDANEQSAAASRIQSLWRCYRAAAVASSLPFNGSAAADEEMIAAAQVIQDSWRRYQRAPSATANGDTVGDTDDEDDAPGRAEGGGGRGDGGILEDEDEEDALLNDVVGTLSNFGGRNTSLQLLDALMVEEEQEEDDEAASSMGSIGRRSRQAHSVTTRVEEDDEGDLDPEDAEAVAEMLQGLQSSMRSTSSGESSGTGGDGAAMSAQETEEREEEEAVQTAVRLIQRNWRRRQSATPTPVTSPTTGVPTLQAEGSTDPSVLRPPDGSTPSTSRPPDAITATPTAPSEARAPPAPTRQDALVNAVRTFQFRFRMNRLRQMVHDRDRSEAAAKVQEVWRRRRMRRQHYAQLEQGRLDAAAVCIQRFLQRTTSSRSMRRSHAAGEDTNGDIDGNSSAPRQRHITVCNATTQTAMQVQGDGVSGSGDSGSSGATNTTTFTCIICLESSVQVALLPCGHAQYCSECASRLRRCPNCRQHVALRVRIFL